MRTGRKEGENGRYRQKPIRGERYSRERGIEGDETRKDRLYKKVIRTESQRGRDKQIRRGVIERKQRQRMSSR